MTKKRPLGLLGLFRVTFLLVSILTYISSRSVSELSQRIGQIVTFNITLFNTLV